MGLQALCPEDTLLSKNLDQNMLGKELVPGSSQVVVNVGSTWSWVPFLGSCNFCHFLALWCLHSLCMCVGPWVPSQGS